jgi:NAD(P)H-dependent FMN reductase
VTAPVREERDSPAGRLRQAVGFLVVSASLRKDSWNSRLARLVARIVGNRGSTADLGEMNDFTPPAYDQDIEAERGLPPETVEFCRRIEANDAFIIVSPEYNASVPGHLKNAIDWASRKRPQPFHARHALLLSASPSMVGGNRGLWALRIPLEHLGARVYPDMFSLAQANTAFAPDGGLVSASLARRLESTIVSFMDLVEAATHYPRIRTDWFEFLGDHPNPVIDRVE